MLHETLRLLRKQRGYSQEEVAGRLNVVRQTVSKWEKGLSVPDADALMRLAELYEVAVSDLLGMPPQEAPAEQTAAVYREIAEQLSRINEQLVIRNRRASRIWRIVGIVLLAWLLLNVLAIAAFSVLRVSAGPTVVEQHELIDP